MRHAYDIDNGIYTEAHKREHPYAAVEAHVAETNAFHGLFHLYAERYERYGVYERFKITLTEFLAYSPEDCEWMINYCEVRQQEEKKIMETAQKQAGNTLITDKDQVGSSLRALQHPR